MNASDFGVGADAERVLRQDPEKVLASFFDDVEVRGDILVPTSQGLVLAFDPVRDTDAFEDMQRKCQNTAKRFRAKPSAFPAEWQPYAKSGLSVIVRALVLASLMNGFYESFKVEGDLLVPLGDKFAKWKPWDWMRLASSAGAVFGYIWQALSSQQMGKGVEIEVTEIERAKKNLSAISGEETA